MKKIILMMLLLFSLEIHANEIFNPYQMKPNSNKPAELQFAELLCGKYMEYFTLGVNDVFGLRLFKYSFNEVIQKDNTIEPFKREFNFDMYGFLETGYRNGYMEGRNLREKNVTSLDDPKTKELLFWTNKTCIYKVATSFKK
jgi:hypothetical protein